MENISLKLEKEFLKELERVMKKHNYMTKTEFIREAIRDKIKRLEGHGLSKEKEEEQISKEEPKNLSYVR